MIKQISLIAVVAIGIGVLLIPGTAMFLVPLQYVKAQSGMSTYTDPSTGKSIQYPDTWNAQSDSNGGVSFSDSNGLAAAHFVAISPAFPNDLERSVIASIQQPTVHDLSVNIVNMSGQPVAQFSYNLEISNPDFESTQYLPGPHLAPISGISVIQNGTLFGIQSYPGLSLDANYQQEIEMMISSLLANNTNNNNNS